MRKLFAVLMLCALPSCQALEPVEVIPPPLTNFEFVCEQMNNINVEWTCEGLEPPVIVMTSLVYWLRPSSCGAYVPGERYVFVDPDPHPLCSGARITTLHEITHYVFFANGMKDRCKSEEIARFVAGQPGEWRQRYGCVKGK